MNNSEPNIEQASLHEFSIPRPWIRCWARLLDVLLYGSISTFLVIIGGLASRGIHGFIHSNLIINFIILSLIGILGCILTEANLIATSAGSIGHRLFKIKILAQDGQPPTFFQGVKRSTLMYIFGVGCFLCLCFLVGVAKQYDWWPVPPFASFVLGALYIQKFKVAFWDTVGKTSVYNLPLSGKRITMMAFLLLILAVLFTFLLFICGTLASLSIPDCELNGGPEGC